jgi:hypothetical protein
VETAAERDIGVNIYGYSRGALSGEDGVKFAIDDGSIVNPVRRVSIVRVEASFRSYKLLRHRGKRTMKTHEMVPNFFAPLRKKDCKGLLDKRTRCKSRVSRG